jgi:endonuclease/exonuclease/phosphatase family metal-dependent hydrolase
MIIKTLTWNIGGAYLLKDGADPALLASYNVEGIDKIIDFIKSEDPDFITLQETQKNDSIDQAEIIAKALDMEYFFHDTTSKSHLDEESNLGHAIISKYPIISHETGFFDNPNVQVIWEDGSTATTFDKGYTNCIVKLDSVDLQVSTLHLTPFKRFNIELDSEVGSRMLDDVQARAATKPKCYLLQGDFNINAKSLEPFLPKMFEEGVKEVITNDATTPKNQTYDHILYKGMKERSARVDNSVLTDHYPIIATFEIV